MLHFLWYSVRYIALSTVSTLFLIPIVILLTRKYYFKPILFFTLIMLQIAIATACIIFLNFPDNKSYNHFAILLNMLIFLLGPTLYLYILSYFEPEFKIRIYHIVPYLVFTIFLIYFIYVSLFTSKPFSEAGFTGYRLVELTVNIFYLALILFYFKSKKIVIRNLFFSNIDSRFIWIRFLYLTCIIFYGIKLYAYIVLVEFGRTDLYQTAVVIYCIYAIIFFILFLYLIITKQHLLQESRKYENSYLNDTEKMHYMNRLDEYMITEKPYTDPEFSLSKLAGLIKLPPKKLSQIINIGFDTNFYHYVNTYRIKDSISLLKNPGEKSKTILEILYAVGFNSKSTFNSAFKRYTGLTPLIYRRRLLNDKKK